MILEQDVKLLVQNASDGMKIVLICTGYIEKMSYNIPDK